MAPRVGHVALRFALSLGQTILGGGYESRLLLKEVVADQSYRDDRSVVLIDKEPCEFVVAVMCQFCRLVVRKSAVMSANTPRRSQVDKMEPLLSIGGAASFLGVSRRQIYTLLERGELPYVRVGQRTRFIPADLRSYLERHRGAGS